MLADSFQLHRGIYQAIAAGVIRCQLMDDPGCPYRWQKCGLTANQGGCECSQKRVPVLAKIDCEWRFWQILGELTSVPEKHFAIHFSATPESNALAGTMRQ